MRNNSDERTCNVAKIFIDNLPGWRWARIKQLVLVGLSSSWHSEACNALGALLGSPTAKFVSATISVRAVVNYILEKCLEGRHEWFYYCVQWVQEFFAIFFFRQATVHITANKRPPDACIECRVYLLGLLAMIKCSICSYQYDN